ncbi:hypothetical protein FRC10_000570 [Ceratobasidium sp. 414]|nr:hypothetical protein FRC10_000570 [Ceratobasidium sp. 414]
MPHTKSRPKVHRAFYGKNGEVLHDDYEQLSNLRSQINGIQVRKQKEINEFLEAYINRVATGVEDLRKMVWQLEDKIGGLKQPKAQDYTAEAYQQDQSDTGYSTDNEEGTWKVDYEPSKQGKSNYQSIWEFLTESVDDIDQDKDTSWHTYRDLVDLLDDQGDDDLNYNDVQNPKTHQEAIKDLLQLANKQDHRDTCEDTPKKPLQKFSTEPGRGMVHTLANQTTNPRRRQKTGKERV